MEVVPKGAGRQRWPFWKHEHTLQRLLRPACATGDFATSVWSTSASTCLSRELAPPFGLYSASFNGAEARWLDRSRGQWIQLLVP